MERLEDMATASDGVTGTRQSKLLNLHIGSFHMQIVTIRENGGQVKLGYRSRQL